nr:hypothetical protein [Arthrobacter sp. efr-133-TYG-118]
MRRTGHEGEHRRVHRDHLDCHRGVGGAGRAKAIIILNPAQPPLIMRDTVLALIGEASHDGIRESIHTMAARRT